MQSNVTYEELLLLAVKQQCEAAAVVEQLPAGSAAAGSSIIARQQAMAAAGEQTLNDSAAGQHAGQQQLQPAGLQPAGLPQAGPEAMQEGAAKQLQAELWPSAQQGAQAPWQAQQQPTGMTVVLPQPLPALAAGGQHRPQPEAAVAVAGDGQQLQPEASGVPLPAGSVSGRSDAGGGWSADIRQQAVEALAAAGVLRNVEDKRTDGQRAEAQLEALLAALKVLGRSASARLAWGNHFLRLRAEQQYGLLADLHVVAEGGSGADLLALEKSVGHLSSSQH